MDIKLLFDTTDAVKFTFQFLKIPVLWDKKSFIFTIKGRIMITTFYCISKTILLNSCLLFYCTFDAMYEQGIQYIQTNFAYLFVW